MIKCPECGKEVDVKNGICPSCGYPFDEQELSDANSSNDNTEPTSESCEVTDESDEQESVKDLSNTNSDAKDKKKRIVVGVLIVVVLVVVICAVALSGKSGGEKYSTVSEMQESIVGVYTYYEDLDDIYKIKVTEDTVTMRYDGNDGDEEELSIRSWNPHRGIIKLSKGTITVTDIDKIEYDGNTFTKFGTWGVLDTGDSSYFNSESSSSSESSSGSSSSSSSSNSSNSSSSSSSNAYTSESGYTALKVTVDSVKNQSSYTVCSGTVKNTGSKTYKFVKVKGSFKDSNGNVLDTDSTYAVGSEGLAPGESSTFTMYVTKNSKITTCSVSIYDYEN